MAIIYYTPGGSFKPTGGAGGVGSTRQMQNGSPSYGDFFPLKGMSSPVGTSLSEVNNQVIENAISNYFNTRTNQEIKNFFSNYVENKNLLEQFIFNNPTILENVINAFITNNYGDIGGGGTLKTVFKITGDNEDGTYTGIKQVLTSGPDTWGNDPTDGSTHTLVNAFEKIKGYNAGYDVDDYVEARKDLIGTTPYYTIIDSDNGIRTQVFKITADNNDGTYNALRQVLSTSDADTWSNHPTDSTSYTLRNLSGRQVGLYKVDNYVWARFDGEVDNAPVFHILDAGTKVPTNPKIMLPASLPNNLAQVDTWEVTDAPGSNDGIKIINCRPAEWNSTDKKLYQSYRWLLFTWDGRFVKASAETRTEIATGACT